MIAYVSDESGRNQIYVRGFMGKANAPAGSGKWQISKDGGSQPRWRADGKELLYAAADGRMMSAGVKATSPTFEVDDARPCLNLDRRLGYRKSDYRRIAESLDGKKVVTRWVKGAAVE